MTRPNGDLYVGIEAGGTKFIVATGSGPDDLLPVVRIPTIGPGETLTGTLAAIDQLLEGRSPAAIGVATFGPVDLQVSSPTYGQVLGTPKPGWEGADLLGPLRGAFDVTIGLDTDVNGAALAEGRWGAGQGLDHLVYITVGTGIGGGALVDGAPLHGIVHPEMGHLLVRRHPDDDFPGRCPFHGDCLEGLASGPALEDRWGAGDGAGGDAMLKLEAWYLAQLVASVTFVLSPQRVVLGGGVMHRAGLLEAVQQQVPALLADYPRRPTTAPTPYVVAPGLGDRAGVLGAIALAETAAGEVSA